MTLKIWRRKTPDPSHKLPELNRKPQAGIRMQYKTIMLELLHQYPELHSPLKQHRKLLAAMEAMARELKENHERITDELTERQPGGDSSGISSQAMEIAIAEMQERLAALSNREEDGALTLDQIMELVTQHSPRE